METRLTRVEEDTRETRDGVADLKAGQARVETKVDGILTRLDALADATAACDRRITAVEVTVPGACDDRETRLRGLERWREALNSKVVIAGTVFLALFSGAAALLWRVWAE